MSSQKRGQRKRFTGRVAGAGKMARTITVEVSRFPWHPKLKKQFRRSSRFLVHDPREEARVGDQVVIESTRPLSKRKHFRVVEIVKRGTEAVPVTEQT